MNYGSSKQKKSKPNPSVNVEDMDKKINDLKKLLVSDDNMDLIKLLLAETIDHRKQMLKITKLDFLEHFPYFFTKPELVCLNTFFV